MRGIDLLHIGLVRFWPSPVAHLEQTRTAGVRSEAAAQSSRVIMTAADPFRSVAMKRSWNAQFGEVLLKSWVD